MPASPARADEPRASAAAPFPSSLTPGMGVTVGDDPVFTPVAETWPLAEALYEPVAVIAALADALAEVGRVMVIVELALLRVTVLVRVEVRVAVVVPEVVTASWAKARSGSSRAAERMLVNCIVEDGECRLVRVDPR